MDVTASKDRQALTAKTLAAAKALEAAADVYIDEYDDSFDDVAPAVRDGRADAESSGHSGQPACPPFQRQNC